MTQNRNQLANYLRSLPRWKRKKAIEKILASLTESEALDVLHDWRGFWARDEQLAPFGSWHTWLICAGRGFGKTRTGAEWVQEKVLEFPGCRIALVGRTAADVRDVMIQGESGLIEVSHPKDRPVYMPSTRSVVWPNGSQALTFSAEEGNQLRGPQFHLAWCDELAAWYKPEDAWDNLQFGLRLGTNPQCLITTTPRTIKLLRSLVRDAAEPSGGVVITRGSTLANKANLPDRFIKRVLGKYQGSRLARQEIYGDLIEDNAGALWRRVDMLDMHRIPRAQVPELARIVVAVDPAVTNNDDSCETGIVVVGITYAGRGFLLEDASGSYAPAEWAKIVCELYHRHKADCVVAEVNNGGDLVGHTIQTYDRKVPVRQVRATRGKYTRAEPVAILYEQGRIHHAGAYPTLEDQLCQWQPGETSPDRLDALVWGWTFLLIGEQGDAGFDDGREEPNEDDD